MKYIRTYEALKFTDKNPKVGDYVLCEEDIPKWANDDFIKAYDYIATHVGKFVHKIKKVPDQDDDVWGDNIYIIEYENVPEEFHKFFSTTERKVKNKSKDKYYRRESVSNIKHISKNKEDLERILATKKYNL